MRTINVVLFVKKLWFALCSCDSPAILLFYVCILKAVHLSAENNDIENGAKKYKYPVKLV